jgi:hypothetical protein
MSETLTFDGVVDAFPQCLDQLPDPRQGNNTTYELKDAALGAFAVFFNQIAIFLANQRRMQETKGRSNAQTLFGSSKPQPIPKFVICLIRLSQPNCTACSG